MDNNQIDIQILQNALACIDAAISRGAYKGNEISSVGAVRDSLESKINFFVEQQKTFQENLTNKISDEGENNG